MRTAHDSQRQPPDPEPDNLTTLERRQERRRAVAAGHGWVKVYRSILDHEWLARDPIAKAAWVDILLAAEYRGEHAARCDLAAIPTRQCITRKVWRRVLARFVDEGMLTVEPPQGRGRGGGVTQFAWIAKYREYQNGGPPKGEVETASRTLQLALPEGVEGQCNGKRATQRATQGANVTSAETATSTALPSEDESGRATQGATQRATSLRSRPKEVKEGRKGDERPVRAAPGSLTEDGHPPDENLQGRSLDIDEEPPPHEPRRDDLDADPRLTPEASLMSHLTGNGSLIRDARDARGFFRRLLGANNAKHPQIEPRHLDWYRTYGTEYIEAVWREALTDQHPKHARKTPLYYLIDALDGKFTPNAAAKRDAEKRRPRELRTDLIEGEPVLLPDGTTAILDSLDPVWAMVEGHASPIRPELLRPAGRASS